MKQWHEFNLNDGEYTGNTHLFCDGITPKYYLNMKDGGDWIMTKKIVVSTLIEIQHGI